MNEDELKEKLSTKEYSVLREGDTELPFSGKYVHTKEAGSYRCKVCGNALFSSGAKFDSGTGWPSFDKAINGAVRYNKDMSGGMTRTEVVCAQCDSHLGHVLDDGPSDTTGKRYCINSVCLELKKEN